MYMMASDRSPESLLAFLRCELVKRFGLLLSQKGFVVVIKVLGIVVFQVAEGVIVVNTVLLLCGFAGSINHTEGKAHNKRPQLHLVNKHCVGEIKEAAVNTQEGRPGLTCLSVCLCGFQMNNFLSISQIVEPCGKLAADATLGFGRST